MSIPAFIETPRFPDTVGFGSTGGPGFKTDIFTSASGFEQRNLLWQEARCEFNVSTGVREKADMDDLLSFFYQVRGKAVGFRFKDWGDYELTNEQFGTGNSSQLQFQLTKTYGTGATAYVRRITKPVTGTLAITVNMVPQTEGVDFTVDYSTGIVTFAIAPGAYAIRASGEFDVPCRFDTDKLPRSYEDWQALSTSVAIVELKGAA